LLKEETTTWLLEATQGSSLSVDKLIPAVYEELRRIASRHMNKEWQNNTMSTTGLVHEAYINLVDQTKVDWRSKAHFCAIASRVMRQILIQHARKRNAVKRGGDLQRIDLGEDVAMIQEQAGDLLDLDKAITRLEEKDERMARIVECRFFGGMTVEETAEALEMSVRTVERNWTKARTYLLGFLKGTL